MYPCLLAKWEIHCTFKNVKDVLLLGKIWTCFNVNMNVYKMISIIISTGYAKIPVFGGKSDYCHRFKT